MATGASLSAPPVRDPPLVFVLMPFAVEFDDVYHMGIKAACTEAGARCERVDEQIFDESVLTRVYEQISAATVVVADMTGRNANVFYEVGYAHALGKRVVLVTRQSEDVPFDLIHYPHIIYGGSITTLKGQLLRKLQWFLTAPSHASSAPNAWGLRAIYRTRAEMNQSCNAHFARSRNRLDVMGFGLRSFRDAMHPVVRRKIADGLELRILCPDPTSIFVAQREREEREVPGQIGNAIVSLGHWVGELKRDAPAPDRISLRYYDSMPLNFYFRHDDALFVGPYLYGLLSQQTVSFEFTAGSYGYQYYSDYFESLWSDDAFARSHARADPERPGRRQEGQLG